MIRRSCALPVLALAGLLSSSAMPVAPTLTTETLISRLTTAIDNLKTLRCNVRAQERIAGKYQQARTAMKMSFNPYKVYLRNDQGIEVLYVTGQNSGDAWVYPNSFPYVTLSLDPQGSIMRKSQHHSVMDAGYGTISELLDNSDQRLNPGFEKTFRYTGDTTVAGRPAHVLRSSFPQFRYVSYKPAKAETVKTIASKFGCGEYRILERNGLSPGATVAAGKTIQVPNAYGSRITICIDQKLYLPLVVQVNDDKGLFEKFEFSNLVANQPIPAPEFAKGYKGYKL